MFGQFNDSPVVETKTAPTEQEGETTKVEVESETTESVEEQAAQETTTEDTDSEDSDVQEAEDTDTEEVKKPKKGFEKRIERFNHKLSQKDQEIEYWKKAAMGGSQGVVQPVQAPQGKPTFAEYNDIETYTEALTDWKVSQALSKVTETQQVKNVVDGYAARLNEFKKVTPDFQDVMDEFVDEYGDRPIQEVVQVAMESEVGPAIAYYLAKNTSEVDRIALLPPHRRLLELGKLEERLSKATTQQKEVVPETKKISKAPAPIESVKGSGRVETNDIYADLPYEQWVKIRTKKK